ncbi:hypothetical protein KIPB_013469, partial [Kipferlia bialata]|eukprot:g13469.t1
MGRWGEEGDRPQYGGHGGGHGGGFGGFKHRHVFNPPPMDRTDPLCEFKMTGYRSFLSSDLLEMFQSDKPVEAMAPPPRIHNVHKAITVGDTLGALLSSYK